MTQPSPENLRIALLRLIEIQMHPNHFTKHKLWSWQALDALAPELALLPPEAALERVREESC